MKEDDVFKITEKFLESKTELNHKQAKRLARVLKYLCLFMESKKAKGGTIIGLIISFFYFMQAIGLI